MKKGRCSLCGGKLVGNRCRLCGLDNSFNDKERRYERESSVQGYVKEEKGRSDTAADIKKKNVKDYVYKPGSFLKRTKNKAKPGSKDRFMKRMDAKMWSSQKAQRFYLKGMVFTWSLAKITMKWTTIHIQAEF